ncbi:MAG: exonuclease domain-containing protein [Methylotenera sp.]|uniref:3'-5' exonuclease n=1 Tax=Methylotenera sp. TaxID=2051956 RepID=UPI0024883757|nr:3'-5' exonuclease [Methylotenera sp.]MDI1308443.1 exonuclease domain-containing protein [Methylotenera sp.]
MGNWNFNEVVVIDLEATCWATPEEAALNTSEIIEIGVCVLDATTGEIRKPRGLIVKPQLSIVSDFCTELTSITPEMVEQGMSFEDAVNILKKDYGISKKIVAGYGNYDQTMFKRECERRIIKLPFGPTYLNISAMATLKAKAGKRLGLSRACQNFGLPFEGQLHRGVDDAVMAAKVLWEIIK